LSKKDLSIVAKHFPYYEEIFASGQRSTYPLSALKVDNLIDKSFAIVGHAAHVVHAIAGQGVNLGLRDAKILADVIVESRYLRLDVGSDTVLKKMA
jgi:2-octaprenyl-6-methoxyphenol hydroxylase